MLNHKERSNANCKFAQDSIRHRMQLKDKRGIHPGQELTVSYGDRNGYFAS